MTEHDSSGNSCLNRLARASDGQAVLEYALLLALLIAGGAAAYLAAGIDVNRVFQVMACLVGEERGEWLLGTVASTEVPRRTRHILPDRQRETHESTAHNTVPWLGIAVWAATVAAGLLPWCILRRRLRARRGDPSDGQLAAVECLSEAQQRLAAKRRQIRRLLLRRVENASGFDAQVQHLMSADLVIVKPGVSAHQAAATMKKQRIRHLLVCQKNRRLLGIISDRDLKERIGKTAEEIMTPEPFVIPREMVVGSAIAVMVNKSISCLPVVDQGKVCGVLTTTDLMLSLQCTLQIVGGIASGLCLDRCLLEELEPRAADEEVARGSEGIADELVTCQ